MRERGTLFNGGMVRAILDDRKTQTRRIMKRQPTIEPMLISADGCATAIWPEGLGNRTLKCPYGNVGDRLWVRETFVDLTESNGQTRETLNADTGLYERTTKKFVWYRADGPQPDVGNGVPASEPWTPSIFMPRWASRITLEITDVRVERLNDINEEDAEAEGVEPNCGMIDHSDCADHFGEWLKYPLEKYEGDYPAFSAKESFSTLWESINGEGSWDANPWVWVIEFKRVEQ